MDVLGEMISKMDFDYLGSGQHGMSLEGLRKNINNENYFFLDVRTKKETEYVVFPFAHNIPLNEIPQKLEELPKDKTIVTFCSSVFRGAIAYAYLISQGFTEIKVLTVNTEDMVNIFKPGPLYKS